MTQSESFKYPFEETEPAKKPSREMIVSLNSNEGESGAGEPPDAVPSTYLKREKSQAVTGAQHSSVQLPKWFYARVERQATSDVILEDLEKRLRRAPSEKTFRVALQILNELSRRHGGKNIRAEFIQEIFDVLQSKEG